MLSQRKAEFLGQKEKRDKSSLDARLHENSVIVSHDNQRITLLPGKDRKGKGSGTNLVPWRENANSGHAVKLALDEKGNVLVAKISHRPKEFDELLRDYEVLKKLGKNPILVVTEHYKKEEESEHVYLFQPFIEGEPLCSMDYNTGFLPSFIEDYSHKIKWDEKRDSLVKLAEIMLKIFDLIDALHAKKIIHMDLHVLNILWDANSNSGTIINFDGSICMDEYRQENFTTPHCSVEHLKLVDFEAICQHVGQDLKQIAVNFKLENDAQLEKFILLMKQLDAFFEKGKQDKNEKPSNLVLCAREKLNDFINELRKQSIASIKRLTIPSIALLETKNEKPKLSVGRRIADFFTSLGRKIANLFSCCVSGAAASSDDLVKFDMTSHPEPEEKMTSPSSSYTGAMQAMWVAAETHAANGGFVEISLGSPIKPVFALPQSSPRHSPVNEAFSSQKNNNIS